MSISPTTPGTDWIDELTDSQCMEVFWLYVDPPEEFLERHRPELLGAAMRWALKQIALSEPGGQSESAQRASARPSMLGRSASGSRHSGGMPDSP